LAVLFGLLIFAFRPLSEKQKYKKNPLRAQRLCGKKYYQNAPF
jgi:hypothetical protein